jgi:hypothetical protein
MVNYRCFRCGFQAKQLSHLRDHCDRVFPCKPLLGDIPVDFDKFVKMCQRAKPHTCPKCSKGYGSKASLYQHSRKCTSSADDVSSSAAATNITNNFDNSSHVSNVTNNINNSSHITNVTNNIDNSTHVDNSTTNITIQVLPFGKENLQDILDDKQFLIKCVKSAESSGMVSLMKRIHFDDAHPENKNVKVRSQKRQQMEVMGEDERWHVVDQTDTLDRMMRRGKVMLFNVYFDELRENDEDDFCMNLLRGVFDQNNNTYYLVRRKIHTLAVDETCKT